MRYLYGDSAPFPLGYNFLATLEGFMAAATRIVQLELETQLLAKQRDELANVRVRGLESLEQFHTVVMRAIRDTAQKVHHQHALDYARMLAENATRYIEDHRQATLASNERDARETQTDAERRVAETRACLEGFLKAAELPVLKTKLSLRLTSDGKDARYGGTAAFEHPDGIATAFTLAPQRVASWPSARKLSDFVQGATLKVGREKSWLRGTVTPKNLLLDDWTISQLDASDDALELVLRRRLTEKETLVLHARRAESGGISATAQHPGAAGAEALPDALGSQDLAELERVWAALDAATRAVLEQREQLLDVSLDGRSVLHHGLAVPLVVRLVTTFAPVVREIAKRSPNEFELTLKTESDDGRREELYLRKDALTKSLQPLPARGRELFAPLGLDTWVPSKTNAPPPVALPPPSARPPASSDLPPASTGAPPEAPPAAKKLA